MPEERVLRVQVEQCARDLARTINSGAADWRQQMRDAAIALLQNEVDISEAVQMTSPSAASPQTSNPFAIAIPLFMVGAVMVILFPPVGLMLFATAAVMAVWGVATVFLRR